MVKKAALKFIGFMLALGFVFALPQRATAQDEDPPSRVARLGYVEGAVSFEPAGTEDWVDAELNRPITTGDRIWTDRGSRAELHMGSASIHLSGETGFSFLDLNDRITQIRLTEGSINVRVRRLYRDETFEIDTPNLAFTIWHPGRYRITVDQNGDTTTVGVREGQGEVTGGGANYTLYADDFGTFRGFDHLDADIEGINGEDSFDRWSYNRERRIDHSLSARYVSSDAVGYEDLDQYGGWRSTREYGTVWFPHTNNSNWAPYRYGHWDWIAPWGWTWIDDEPWGFAPFHYGRWINEGGSWGWVPCPPQRNNYGNDYAGGVYDRGEYVRPVYAPALVAWVGGSGFSVSIGLGGGGGSVGWFPLGPREVYVPSYPVSRNYVENVNVTNTTVNTTVINNVYNNTVVNNNTVNNNTVNNVNVTNIKYVNQAAPNAVTATSAAAFTSAKPVAKNIVQVSEKQLAAAPVAVVAPRVAPPKQAILGSGQAAAAKPPANLVERTVVAKIAPPPPPPSFEARTAAIQQNGGKPLSVTQEKKLQPEPQKRAASAPVVKVAPPAQPAAPRVDNSPKASIRQTEAKQPPQNRPGAQNAQAPPPSGNNQGNQPPQNNANRPVAAPPPQQQQQNTAPQNNVNRPPAAQPQQQRQNNASNAPQRNDRPPAPTLSPAPDPKLEEKHQQELQLLQQKQDQERQRVDQEHRQQQLALEQQKANEEKQHQAQQEQQRQQLQKEQQAAAQKNANDQKQHQLQQEQQRQQQLAAEQQKASEEKQRQAQQELQRQQQQKLAELEQKHAQEQKALQQKQEQEHQQQLQQQQQRQQPPPQQRQQPPAQQQKQQRPPAKQDPNKKPDPNQRDDRPPNR